MIAEIGLFSLILALLFSGLLVLMPSLGLRLNRESWVAAADTYVIAQSLFVVLAYLALSLAFLLDDFSVVIVALHSSRDLPWFYKFCAVWGGHEGSMLLWVMILSAWMVMVALLSKSLDTAFRTRVLVVLGALSFGLLLFLLATSNPFLRQFQGITEGRDLNPLLQDPGFLFHPPMLYLGYVGFSVAFAFAIAALWLGRVETSWLKWTRPWTLAAWCFLSLGITLGSWWAYRELGWGGWWFWDPVENASFMPWLAGTALLHSLMVTEKRSQFMAWTLLLAITVFSLSLVGTFLVRSGILTSVHAFAVDPLRGSYILVFLGLVVGGSLMLFSLRARTLASPSLPAYCSRESMLLLNNVFLVVILFTVLLGTLYPLLVDGLGLGKISVGAPYFNAVFVPLLLPLLFLMGIGIHTHWQKDSFTRVFKTLWPYALLSLLPCLLFIWFHLSLSCLFGLILALWVLLSTLKALQKRFSQGRGLSLSFLGMMMAHAGVAIAVLGVAVSTGFGSQDDVVLSPGQSTNLAGYSVYFERVAPLKGPNYQGIQAKFIISKGWHHKAIYPEKRHYTVAQTMMTDAAIDVNPFRDIYIALGEPLKGGAWSLRIYFKPLVRGIWLGGFMIFFGGLLALLDRRYYTRVAA